MPSWAKVLCNGAIRGKESLDVSWGLEPLRCSRWRVG
jgi:hypothetical protein